MPVSKNFNENDWKRVGKILKPKATAVRRVLKEVVGTTEADEFVPNNKIGQALIRMGYDTEQSRKIQQGFGGQGTTVRSLQGLLSRGMRPQSGKNVGATSEGYARTS